MTPSSPPPLPAAQVVEGEARRGKRLMVFANTVSSCRAVEHSLSERLGAGATACYHGDVPREERAAALAAFGSDAPPLLICTDLAARCISVGKKKRGYGAAVCVLWGAGAGGLVDPDLAARYMALLAGQLQRRMALLAGQLQRLLSFLAHTHPHRSAAGKHTRAYPPHAQLAGGA